MKGQVINSMKGLDKKIRRKRMHSGSARQELLVVKGRGLRLAVDARMMLMMLICRSFHFLCKRFRDFCQPYQLIEAQSANPLLYQQETH